jgi:hypothetical protein
MRTRLLLAQLVQELLAFGENALSVVVRVTSRAPAGADALQLCALSRLTIRTDNVRGSTSPIVLGT